MPQNLRGSFLAPTLDSTGMAHLKRLATAGLFDADRKRPLPVHPRRIGVVTSLQSRVPANAVEWLVKGNDCMASVAGTAVG